MAIIFKTLRSSTPGKIPTTAELDEGVIFINTADGRVFIKQVDGQDESIVELTRKRASAKIIAQAAETINPNHYESYRIDAAQQATSTLTFPALDPEDCAEITLTVIGQPTLTINGVTKVDRYSYDSLETQSERFLKAFDTLGTNFTIYTFIWSGSTWIGYKKVEG